MAEDKKDNTKRLLPQDANALSRVSAWSSRRSRSKHEIVQKSQEQSSDLLYESMMKSGGQAFGQPYVIGTTSLTERVVRRHKQKGSFGYSTYEKMNYRRRNYFTRAGASRYQGEYPPHVIEWIKDPSKRPKKSLWTRFWDMVLVRVDDEF